MLIWADGALKWAKSKENDIYWGGAMHTWRFTWQTFSPEKRHVRRQFEVFSMPAEPTPQSVCGLVIADWLSQIPGL